MSKKVLAQEEIRQRLEKIEIRFRKIKSEEKKCWKLLEELQKRCTHPNKISDPDGERCPDCGKSSRLSI